MQDNVRTVPIAGLFSFCLSRPLRRKWAADDDVSLGEEKGQTRAARPRGGGTADWKRPCEPANGEARQGPGRAKARRSCEKMPGRLCARVMSAWFPVAVGTGNSRG
ncbi:hypothetical protein CCMA1212_001237 [Trichoderma ghanense]|uniref:Uncharacterized protein n=1 Tax=Trichoderma ghanense TaxID=65468 RepID=A0ABY2HGM9_9HYPO